VKRSIEIPSGPRLRSFAISNKAALSLALVMGANSYVFISAVKLALEMLKDQRSGRDILLGVYFGTVKVSIKVLA
jgi:hypothetical protein